MWIEAINGYQLWEKSPFGDDKNFISLSPYKGRLRWRKGKDARLYLFEEYILC